MTTILCESLIIKHATDVSDSFSEVTPLYHEPFKKFIEVWGQNGNLPIKPMERGI
jgi:hypothetical protein